MKTGGKKRNRKDKKDATYRTLDKLERRPQAADDKAKQTKTTERDKKTTPPQEATKNTKPKQKKPTKQATTTTNKNKHKQTKPASKTGERPN